MSLLSALGGMEGQGWLCLQAGACSGPPEASTPHPPHPTANSSFLQPRDFPDSVTLGMGTSGGAECVLLLEEHGTKPSNVFITEETPNDFKRANSG